jgi:hypothetical protein
MLTLKSEHFINIPQNHWIALSQDTDRVIAHDVELKCAIQKAKDAGEDDPVMVGRNFLNGDIHL